MLKLIKRLLDQGILTPEQLHEAMIETPDKQIMGVAETLHSLTCHEHHPSPTELGDRNEEYCYFYSETGVKDCWTQPEHKTWVLEAVGLMERLNLPLPSDLSKFIDSLVVTVKLVDNLLGKYPEGKEVLRKACGI